MLKCAMREIRWHHGVYIILGCVGGMTFVSAQVMQSSNYQIEFDSVNVGGARSSSTSYSLEDTTGEIATGPSDSASFQLRAGYQQMNETYLALTPASNITLTPSLGGIVGGEANGSTTVTVTTDNLAGYQLTIVSSSSPAMQREGGGDAIADYVPDGAVPDFFFSVDPGNAELGLSVEGTDIADRFRDDGASCSVDTGDATDRCWDAPSTTPFTIAERSSSNHPSGTDTDLKFRAGIGANAGVLEGAYTATSTITLIAL